LLRIFLRFFYCDSQRDSTPALCFGPTHTPCQTSPEPMSEDIVRPADGRATEIQEVDQTRHPDQVPIHAVTIPLSTAYRLMRCQYQDAAIVFHAQRLNHAIEIPILQ
jgi:hypothetical protein